MVVVFWYTNVYNPALARFILRDFCLRTSPYKMYGGIPGCHGKKFLLSYWVSRTDVCSRTDKKSGIWESGSDFFFRFGWKKYLVTHPNTKNYKNARASGKTFCLRKLARASERQKPAVAPLKSYHHSPNEQTSHFSHSPVLLFHGQCFESFSLELPQEQNFRRTNGQDRNNNRMPPQLIFHYSPNQSSSSHGI